MKIAIVGATGLVGTNIISLCEKYFDIDVEYSLFASKSSEGKKIKINDKELTCLLYTSPSPRDLSTSRMPSSA